MGRRQSEGDTGEEGKAKWLHGDRRRQGRMVGRRAGNGGEQSGRSVALAAVVSLIFAHASH